MNKINSQDTVTIFGGNGFIGSQIVKVLSPYSSKIKIISRSVNEELKICGAVGQIGFKLVDVARMQNYDELVAGSTYVINCIGILHQKGDQTYENMHTNVGRLIAQSCMKHQVKRLVHISALNADINSKSIYLKTKGQEERNILDHFENATILRPSVVFGPQDDFINMYSKIIKISPFIPVLSQGKTRIQPIYVKDIAQSVEACLMMEEKDVYGKTFHIAGPQVYTMREVIELLLKLLDKHRMIINLNNGLANISAYIMKFMNKPPLSYEKIKLAQCDSVAENSNDVIKLGVKPISMETILPHYVI